MARADSSITKRQETAIIRQALAILARRVRPGENMGSPFAVKAWLQLRLHDESREIFMGLFLDAQNRLIAAEELARGTLTQCAVHPREVVKRALHHNAAGVIFAHNHPSGTAEPSMADRALTEALRNALALVDVRALDHLIITAGCALSFAERGLMEPPPAAPVQKPRSKARRGRTEKQQKAA
jgi:DNA repair protein RadC